LNVFFTLLAGAGAFVFGQIVMKLLIDPIQSFKVTIAEIANKLILYAKCSVVGQGNSCNDA
jgi:hypothetical protein